MATKKYYIGSLGPFLFDDTANIDDPDGDFAGETLRSLTTNGQLRIEQAPVDSKEILRLEDITSKIFSPIAVVDIDNPTELGSLVGEAGSLVIVYEVEANRNQVTLYSWDSANGAGASSPYVVSDGATGFWVAIAGKYISDASAIEDLTASSIVTTDANKFLTSLAILISTLGGTGISEPTDHTLIVGSGSSAMTELGVATNGQLPIGSTGVDPVLATITGTANEITITIGTGSITLSIPSGAVITFANNGLHILDTNASHDLIIIAGSDLTADRNLTFITGDAARTITLSGNPTLADWFDQAVKIASSPTFAGALFTDDITLPKTAGKGIRIDTAVPTFGWRDLKGKVTQRNIGASKPTHATYRDTLAQYQFAAGKEEYFTYHIDHDHVPDSDVHLHVHWSHTGALVNGGTITIEYEISYAKGFNQSAFGASVTATFAGTASTTQYQKIISEIQISAVSPSASQIDSNDLEPDGIIECRIKITSNDITVSGGGVPDPFIHEVDIHYQSTSLGTKQKAPDFYV